MAFTLAALALTYALTGSEDLQLLLLGLLLFGLLPAIDRKLGVPDEYSTAVATRTTPFRILALSALLWAPGAAVLLYAAPEVELGAYFWVMAILWPWMELHLLLAERDLRRHGVDSWPTQRPLRDSFLAGAATTVLITVITLFQDYALAEAVATGALCGFAMLIVGGSLGWLLNRAQTTREPQA